MLAKGGIGHGGLGSSVAGDGSRKHLGRGRRVRSHTNTLILYDIVIHIIHILLIYLKLLPVTYFLFFYLDPGSNDGCTFLIQRGTPTKILSQVAYGAFAIEAPHSRDAVIKGLQQVYST